MESKRLTGTIMLLKRSYGFVRVAPGENYFLHKDNVPLFRYLERGDLLSFEPTDNDGKGLQAVKVEVEKHLKTKTKEDD